MALSKTFTGILEDRHLRETYLIINVLDECTKDLRLLLALAAQKSSAYSSVKWIMSSRNWRSTENDLDTTTQKAWLSLELNDESVSGVMTTYVQFKVEGLAKRNKYSNGTRDAVELY